MHSQAPWSITIQASLNCRLDVFKRTISVALLALTAFLAPGSSFAQVSTGSFVSTIRAEHSGACLTAGLTFRPRTRIQHRGCDGTSRQRFTFQPVNGFDNTFTVRHYIKIQGSRVERCVDVSQHRTIAWYRNRPEIYLWACNGRSNQQFELVTSDAGGYLMRSPDGQCMDVAAGSMGIYAPLSSNNCHGRANQRFAIDGMGNPDAVVPGPPDQVPQNPESPELTNPTNDPHDHTGMDPTSMDMPPLSDLPDGMAGSGQLLLWPKARTNRPHVDEVASFRLDCEFSHMNYDDAILKPGQPGQAHLHQYFGNTDVDAFSTNESIINSGNSTCAGGTANRSSYWAPALIDVRTNTPITPDGSTIYYKTGFWGEYPSNTVAPPNGLRVIAGDATESAPDGTRYTTKTDWFCTAQGDLSGPFNNGEAMPSDCRDGDLLRMRVRFPNCWDGQNLDSVDHKSHMAYSVGNLTNRQGCPTSHPVQIPTMTVNVDWIVTRAADVQHWRLASDMYDRSIPAGYSAHADWIVAWNQPIFERMLEGCFRPAEDCGHNNLNDGEGLTPVR